MIEHLGNCHGEWNMILQGLPLGIGALWMAWLKWRHRDHNGCCGTLEPQDGETTRYRTHSGCCDCKEDNWDGERRL